MLSRFTINRHFRTFGPVEGVVTMNDRWFKGIGLFLIFVMFCPPSPATGRPSPFFLLPFTAGKISIT